MDGFSLRSIFSPSRGFKTADELFPPQAGNRCHSDLFAHSVGLFFHATASTAGLRNHFPFSEGKRLSYHFPLATSFLPKCREKCGPIPFFRTKRMSRIRRSNLPLPLLDVAREFILLRQKTGTGAAFPPRDNGWRQSKDHEKREFFFLVGRGGEKEREGALLPKKEGREVTPPAIEGEKSKVLSPSCEGKGKRKENPFFLKEREGWRTFLFSYMAKGSQKSAPFHHGPNALF